MRISLIFLLLASAATPALAVPDDRTSVSEERAQRSARAERAARAEPEPSVRAVRSSGDVRVVRERGGDGDDSRSILAPGRRALRASDSEAPRVRREAGDSVRDWRAGDRRRDDSPAIVEERTIGRRALERSDAAVSRPIERRVRRPQLIEQGDTAASPSIEGRVRRPRVIEREDTAADPTIEGRVVRPRITERDGDGLSRPVRTTPGITDRGLRRIGGNVPTEGAAPPAPTREALERSRTSPRWLHSWRDDRRYDWRDWRRRHRSRFHLGFYYDPFGWRYRRYNVGWRLWPSYYSSSFWLHDPWHYRLPPAYGPYRWVRYHDDAFLVNIYTGEVVDVIYNFFW